MPPLYKPRAICLGFTFIRFNDSILRIRVIVTVAFIGGCKEETRSCPRVKSDIYNGTNV